MEMFRTPSLGDRISGNTEKTAPERLGEEPGYIDKFYSKGQVV